MSTDDLSLALPTSGGVHRRERRGPLTAALSRLTARPELLCLLAVAGFLNLWNLQVNGTANSYYAAAVRSMSTSWHDFLYNAMDKSGLMTVDKPPLADWIQALSVRAFGWSSWSLLVPQAVMGVVATGLTYDLTRRRFGRFAGFVAGFVLATTPTIVAVSRHNNPDELLVMLSVAAVWCVLRAIETGRTRWLIWSGVMVGLGFEAKMGVALMLVPGIALAWVWMRWRTGVGLRGNLRMLGALLWGGCALAVVALAWPLLLMLTPAADRPWISGTSDNSVWSLIFGYNGLGRISGQSGGPGGAGGFGGAGSQFARHLFGTGTGTGRVGTGGLFGASAHAFGGGAGGGNSLFGGSTGPFRLLGTSLGDQAGWLLGAAVVALVALIVLSRMRRRDQRTAYVLVIGVTLLVVGVVFSFASGIFHPYYVSMVAPWAAILIGAGVGEMLPAPLGVASSQRTMRTLGPALIAGGAVTELVVLHEIDGQLGWAEPVLLVTAVIGCALLAWQISARLRLAIVTVALVGLLAAPVTWAADTLGHTTSGTFPTGGPASASVMGGIPGGGPGRFSGGRGRFGRSGGFGGSAGTGGGFGSSGAPSAAGGATGSAGALGGLFGGSGTARSGAPGATSGRLGAAGGFGGGMGDSASLDTAAKWAELHGGGVVAVESQSAAASAILAGHENVAGIGGFSGNESSVTPQWIAQMVREGRLRYLLGGSGSSVTSPSDGRKGSSSAIAIAERVGKKITVTEDGQSITLYDLKGKAAAIIAAAAQR